MVETGTGSAYPETVLDTRFAGEQQSTPRPRERNAARAERHNG